MARRFFWRFGMVPAIAMAAAAFSVSLAAQLATPTAKAAKPVAKSWTTPWGDPDLQGVYDVAGITPLQRPEKFANKEFLTEQEAAALEKAAYDVNHNEVVIEDGDTGYYNRFWRDPGNKIVKVMPNRRTSMIVDPPDGRLPPYTPEAQKLRARINEILKNDGPMVFNRIGPSRLARYGSSFADSYLDRDTIERCMSASLPKLLGAGNNSGVQIAQGPGVVIMNYENRDTRVIPLDGRPHLPSNIRLWLGDPRGRWEGKTLVVDTTNFSDDQGYIQAITSAEGGLPMGRLHLIERYTRIDADTLDYRATIDDPANFTRPWTVAFPWQADPNYVVYENACHEGNDSLTGILNGARKQEQAADANKTR